MTGDEREREVEVEVSEWERGKMSPTRVKCVLLFKEWK